MTLGLKLYKCIDEHQVSEAVPSRMAQSCLRDSEIAVKKTLQHLDFKIAKVKNNVKFIKYNP